MITIEKIREKIWLQNLRVGQLFVLDNKNEYNPWVIINWKETYDENENPIWEYECFDMVTGGYNFIVTSQTNPIYVYPCNVKVEPSVNINMSNEELAT